MFQDELESNLTTTLYLITILTKLLGNCTKEEIFGISRLVFSLNQLQLALRDGQTLLHLCCNSDTPVDDFHTNDVCKYVLAFARSIRETVKMWQSRLFSGFRAPRRRAC